MGPKLWAALGVFSITVIISSSLFCKYGLRLGAPDIETQENTVQSNVDKDHSDDEVLQGSQETRSHNTQNTTTNYSAQLGSSLGIVTICLILLTISYFIYHKYRVVQNPVDRSAPVPCAKVIPTQHIPTLHPEAPHYAPHYTPNPPHQLQYERDHHHVQNLHTTTQHPSPALQPPINFPYTWWNDQNPTFLQNIRELAKLRESSSEHNPSPSAPSPSTDLQEYKVSYLDVRGMLEEQNMKSEEILKLKSEKDSLMKSFVALRGATP